MREIRKKNPHISPTELQKQAEYEMITRGPKSRAFYRVQATRRLIGGGDIVKKRIDKEHNKAIDMLVQAQEKQTRENTHARYSLIQHITQYSRMSDHLTWLLADVKPDLQSGGPKMVPTVMKISIDIVDDDVFEEDEHFYRHMRNLRVRDQEDGSGSVDPMTITPVCSRLSTITMKLLKSCGFLSLRVQRHSGARGKVVIPYRTYDGSAIGDKHFEAREGEVTFDDNQTEAFIEIGVMDTEQYERSDYFFIELGPPIWAKKMSDLSKVQERFQRRMEQKRRASIASESRESSEPG
ncbi:Calx-beta domain protein [Ostertagia ostertagi]